MKSNVAIKVTNLTKSFKKRIDKPLTIKERLVQKHDKKVIVKNVLDNVSFEIPKGQATGINGTGKSTTLKILSKIFYPEKGKIDINGKLVSLIELGAGFHPDFTGRENIYFNASIFGFNKKQIDSIIDDVIAFSELKDDIDLPIRTYSSGMYMRLAFSVVTHIGADILLVDEILSVGDYHFQKKSFNKIKSLIKEGKTVVIVSHDLDLLRKVCDKVIWLDDGKVKMYDDAKLVIDTFKKVCD